MRFEVYINGYAENDAKELLKYLREHDAKFCKSDLQLEDSWFEIDIASIQELMEIIRLHPDKQIYIYAPQGEMASINFESVRDDFDYVEEDDYIEIVKGLKNSKIIKAEEAMDYGTDAIWCETDSGIGFYASRPDWRYPKDTIYKNEPTMVYDWLYCDFINKNME